MRKDPDCNMSTGSAGNPVEHHWLSFFRPLQDIRGG